MSSVADVIVQGLALLVASLMVLFCALGILNSRLARSLEDDYKKDDSQRHKSLDASRYKASDAPLKVARQETQADIRRQPHAERAGKESPRSAPAGSEQLTTEQFTTEQVTNEQVTEDERCERQEERIS